MTMTNQTEYNSKLANFPRPAIAFTAIIYLLLGFLETLEGTFLPALLYFGALGILALYLMPYVFGLPNGRKSLRGYSYDIRLLPITPVGRNILLASVLLYVFLWSALVIGAFLTKFMVERA